MIVPPLRVDVVVARYCEDLAWLSKLPREWHKHVYDKSEGGPRQGLQTSMYRSPDGPSRAALWPGAYPLPNVGCEAQSYLYHIVKRYDSLADVTIFLQGGPHFPEYVPKDVIDAMGYACGSGFAPIGPILTCDGDGRPHHDEPLREIKEMWLKFSWSAVPQLLTWVAAAQFAVTRDRIWRIPRQFYIAARDACTTKLHACAMERLWFELLAKDHKVSA